MKKSTTILKSAGSLVIGAASSALIMSAFLEINFGDILRDMASDYWRTRSLAAASAEGKNEAAPVPIAPRAVTESVKSEVSIHRDLSDSIVLTGVVPNWEAQETAEKLAKRLFPGGILTNQIRVFGACDQPKWVEAFQALSESEALAKVRNATLVMGEGACELSGFVANRELRSTILGEVDGLFTQKKLAISFSPRLEVRAIPAELDLWLGSNKVLLLQGSMNASTKAGIEPVLRKNLPEKCKLADSIKVDNEIKDPVWLPGLVRLLPQMLSTIEQPRLKIREGEVSFKAAPSSQKLALQVMERRVGQLFSNSGYSFNGEISSKARTVEAQSESLSPLERFVSESAVSFASGKTILSKREWRKVRALAKKLKAESQPSILLIGEMDSTGELEADKQLCLKRCEQVRDYLVELGMTKDDIELAEPRSGGRRVRFSLGHEPAASVSTKASDLVSLTGSQSPEVALGIIVGTKVYFDTSKWEIRESELAKLQETAVALRSMPADTRFTILGSADPRGNARFNRYLCRQRCEAVRRFLASNGVDTRRAKVRIMMAAATLNLDDEATLQEHRRVEFELEGKQNTVAVLN